MRYPSFLPSKEAQLCAKSAQSFAEGRAKSSQNPSQNLSGKVLRTWVPGAFSRRSSHFCRCGLMAFPSRCRQLEAQSQTSFACGPYRFCWLMGIGFKWPPAIGVVWWKNIGIHMAVGLFDECGLFQSGVHACNITST